MITGAWRNFEELEESVTLHELNKIVEGVREQEERYIRSFAVIMGAELKDEPESNEKQETAKDRIMRNVRERRGESAATQSLRDAEQQAKEYGFKLGLGYEEVKENNN